MTEAEWLGCTSPLLLLDHLGPEASERKLRLYACAWAVRFWHLLRDDRSREAIVIGERFAEGMASRPELVSAFTAAHAAWRDTPLVCTERQDKRRKSSKSSWGTKRAAEAARNAADPTLGMRAVQRHAQREDWLGNASVRHEQCELLRELFGNPFRPIPVADSWLRWNDGCIIKLARAIYDEHSFGDMPVLADALEEAGCTDPGVLAHCRSDGGDAHVRGCWVLDVLLGRA